MDCVSHNLWGQLGRGVRTVGTRYSVDGEVNQVRVEIPHDGGLVHLRRFSSDPDARWVFVDGQWWSDDEDLYDGCLLP